MSIARGRFRTLYRIAVTLVLGALVIYNVVLVVRERNLRRSLAQDILAIEQLKRERELGKRIREFAVAGGRESLGGDHSIAKLLSECASREDFVVREGPRIAWSELSGSTELAKTIGIYLPAGKHCLQCAVGDRGKMGTSDVEKFRNGDAADLDAVVNWELGPEPEVYELRLTPQTDGSLQISLVGAENLQLAQEKVPVLEGEWIFLANAVPSSLAFPSEFVSNDRSRWRAPVKSRPVIDVAFYDAGRRYAGVNANLRIWIESDARACVSAARVAASLRGEWDGRFEPYDGSGRFYFSD